MSGQLVAALRRVRPGSSPYAGYRSRDEPPHRARELRWPLCPGSLGRVTGTSRHSLCLGSTRVGAAALTEGWGRFGSARAGAAVPVLWALPNAPSAVSSCQVTGVVSDADGKAHYVMSGTWDEKMECSKIVHSSHGSTSTEGKQKTVYQTLSPKVLWKKYPLP